MAYFGGSGAGEYLYGHKDCEKFFVMVFFSYF